MAAAEGTQPLQHQQDRASEGKQGAARPYPYCQNAMLAQVSDATAHVAHQKPCIQRWAGQAPRWLSKHHCPAVTLGHTCLTLL